ncbi:PF20097 family protein [Jeotgalibacillus proteolyticus]|uniref:DUF6487 domain-containing protein n=1 Tax=Jeotgalibacillus proteolyticus TaxID=2082395 RepID=A0A2S5G906_9BACL|nr:PF20097 family protein [Jeotgalibacillus proteolyticus]PPA69476.1 hypothetical protein C4B60_16455 [Jeotgalibacillus proteolyticus]
MDDTIKCPECNNELKNGYLFSSRRISWSDSPESIFVDYESEVLVGTPFFKMKKMPALRCEDCHVVMFKHN